MNDYIFDFGTPVYCYDESCGKLAGIAIDPGTWRVSDLIVEKGLLMKQSRVIPLQEVSWATFDGVSLALDIEELKGFPEYKETVIEKVPEGLTAEPAVVQGSPYGLATSAPTFPLTAEVVRVGLDENLILLNKATTLKAINSDYGTVRGLSAIPGSGQVTNLLIHKGIIFPEDYWLSMPIVQRISDKGVFVDLNEDEIRELIDKDRTPPDPWSRPREELGDTSTPGGPLPVNGNGGTAVPNNHKPLSTAVSEALMDDPRTADAVIEVINENGLVTLMGTVSDPETKEAAGEIARDCTEVVSVSNEIVVDQRQ